MQILSGIQIKNISPNKTFEEKTVEKIPKMELEKNNNNNFHGLSLNRRAPPFINNKSSKVKSYKCHPQTGYVHKSQKLFVKRNFFKGLKKILPKF